MFKPHPIHVLLVESEGREREAFHAALAETSSIPVVVEEAGELAEALERVSEGGVDAMVLSLDLPDSSGVATFERAHAFAPEVPVVVVTEAADESLGLTAVRGGAQDSVVRDRVNPSDLGRVVRYAMERHRLVAALRGLALLDDLTGLYNERGFEELGHRYFDLARRAHRGGHLVVLDVDRLRTINEALGHHVGDRALRTVADLLRSSFRVADLVARTEGDEFAVLALDAPDASGKALADRIRAGVEELNGRGGMPFHLAISVGAVEIGPDASSLGERMDAARQELKVEKFEKRLTIATEDR